MNDSTRILYRAYVNTYALLAHRGYVPEDGYEMVEIGKFAALAESWEDNTNSMWIVFEKGDLFVDVGFPGEVNKERGTSICQHVCAGGSRGNAKRNVHVIIVVSKVLPPAAPDLLNLKKQPFTRMNYIPNNRIEVFNVVTMQINPLLHSRQPPIIRLISDEDEKEDIRSRLVAAASDKNIPLSDLLPIMYLENPLAIWYDAFVDDVFYFVRHDGIPYFRIVKPDPQIDVGAKKKAL